MRVVLGPGPGSIVDFILHLVVHDIVGIHGGSKRTQSGRCREEVSKGSSSRNHLAATARYSAPTNKSRLCVVGPGVGRGHGGKDSPVASDTSRDDASKAISERFVSGALQREYVRVLRIAKGRDIRHERGQLSQSVTRDKNGCQLDEFAAKASSHPERCEPRAEPRRSGPGPGRAGLGARELLRSESAVVSAHTVLCTEQSLGLSTRRARKPGGRAV